MQNNKKVRSKFYKIKNVSVVQLLEMHKLFIQYYNNADFETFVKDMCKKTGVFILEDKAKKCIIGFSTWTEVDLVHEGKSAIGIFSGDTVVDQDYWGDKSLQKNFAARLIGTKLNNPQKAVFWLLISKGYKTYLLLANNFPNFYPSYHTHNKKLESIVDDYCTQLYPEYYCQKSRLLDFGDTYQSLKDGIAGITIEMKEQNQDIRYFEQLNPTWAKGTELPCAGEVSVGALISYIKKAMIPFKKYASRQRKLELT